MCAPLAPCGRQGVPAGAVLVLQGAGAASGRSRQRDGGLALLVLGVVVQAGRHLPIPRAAGTAFHRQAVHVVGLAVVGEREGCGREREAPAFDVDRPAVHRLARSVGQVALGTSFRAVLPPAQGVGGPHGGGEVVGQLELGVVLHRVVLGARAQDVPGLVGGVQPRHVARHRYAAPTWHARGYGGGGEGLRLALAVGVVQVDPPRPIAALAAQRCAGLPTVEGVVRVVQAVGLGREAGRHMRFQLGRHARHVVHHRAGRVARVGRGEGAVHHVHPLDFLGRDHAPARRVVGTVGNAVAQVVGQEDAVRIHRRARAVAGARGARGKNRVVVVADVALAHQQAGQVLEGILAVGGVDAHIDLFARDAFDGGGDLRGQRGRLAARHRHDAKRLDALRRIGRTGARLRPGQARKGGGQRQPEICLAHRNCTPPAPYGGAKPGEKAASAWP